MKKQYSSLFLAHSCIPTYISIMYRYKPGFSHAIMGLGTPLSFNKSAMNKNVKRYKQYIFLNDLLMCNLVTDERRDDPAARRSRHR